MNPTLRNVLAVLGGLLAGSVVNSLLVTLGGILIPPPEGADVSSMEGLKASMSLFEGKHFVTPWIAHAAGTLLGSFIAVKLGISAKWLLAFIVGALFFAGGVTMVLFAGGPVGFIAADLGLAYFPMAWLGYRLAGGGGSSSKAG